MWGGNKLKVSNHDNESETIAHAKQDMMSYDGPYLISTFDFLYFSIRSSASRRHSG